MNSEPPDETNIGQPFFDWVIGDQYVRLHNYLQYLGLKLKVMVPPAIKSLVILEMDPQHAQCSPYQGVHGAVGYAMSHLAVAVAGQAEFLGEHIRVGKLTINFLAKTVDSERVGVFASVTRRVSDKQVEVEFFILQRQRGVGDVVTCSGTATVYLDSKRPAKRALDETTPVELAEPGTILRACQDMVYGNAEEQVPVNPHFAAEKLLIVDVTPGRGAHVALDPAEHRLNSRGQTSPSIAGIVADGALCYATVEKPGQTPVTADIQMELFSSIPSNARIHGVSTSEPLGNGWHTGQGLLYYLGESDEIVVFGRFSGRIKTV